MNDRHYRLNMKSAHDQRCNICGDETAKLSKDHIPPRGCGNVSKIEMRSLLNQLGSSERIRSQEQQNGMQFLTICSVCNSKIGRLYDPSLIELCRFTRIALRSNLMIPNLLNFTIRPNAIYRCILAHLLAAKNKFESNLFDDFARKVVLNPNLQFDFAYKLFFWIHPFNTTHVLRDFLILSELGNYDSKWAFCQNLKFYPYGFLVTDENFKNAPEFPGYKITKFDEELKVSINLLNHKPDLWPFHPGYGSPLLGVSNNGGIMAGPRHNIISV